MIDEIPLDLKQIIVMRTDLGMRCGKRIAQGAHASVNATLYCDLKSQWKLWRERWLSYDKTGGHMKKVALKIVPSNEKNLKALYVKAIGLNIPCALIMDEGLTQIPSNSLTCCAIGPAPSKLIDKITKDLKLL